MNEKIFDELQKAYDNPKLGALIQEICEYYATKDDYECGSYQEEIEPSEITEAAYTLFCLQSRERILDEFSVIRKKYPELYSRVEPLHSTLLVNMDFTSLEEECAKVLSEHTKVVGDKEIISQAELFVRTSENLSEALDRFYEWLHTK